MKIIYLILAFFFISCNQPKRNTIKTIEKQEKPCFSEKAENTILNLGEVIKKRRLLDSLFNYQKGISLITDSTEIDKIPFYKIEVGYNSEIRYETYYTFYVEKGNCDNIKVINIDGKIIDINEWREKNYKKDNIDNIDNIDKKIHINETNNLPFSSSKYLIWYENSRNDNGETSDSFIENSFEGADFVEKLIMDKFPAEKENIGYILPIENNSNKFYLFVSQNFKIITVDKKKEVIIDCLNFNYNLDNMNWWLEKSFIITQNLEIIFYKNKGKNNIIKESIPYKKYQIQENGKIIELLKQNWKLWSDIETHNIKGEPFHSTKGKINDKGELLVELDTSKYKWIKEDIIAVFKIKGKEGNEKGAYIKEWYSLILHSYPQLTKLAENKATVKVGGLLGIGEVERVELEEEGHSCPRCTAPVTVAQLRELFPDVEEKRLKTVADTYTKYMKELQMDTCWNKAHFFAQAAIETGFKLHIKKGENMDSYTEERLYEVFPSRFFKMERVKDKSGNNKFVPIIDPKAEFHDEKNRVFKSKELSQKAKQLINSKPKDQNIANFVYANINGNKNEASGDGWRFRGSGLIQLTGRGNFKMVNDKIEKLWGQSILTDSGADQVRENPELAVLTAMGYFAAKGINRIANGANSDQQIKEVCLKVGDDVDIKINNRKTKNHEEKALFFKNKSSKTFKINECKFKQQKAKKYDIEKAVEHLNKQAKSKSIERCALYVRQAINAGGIFGLNGHAMTYYNEKKLEIAGFTKIGDDINSIELKKGDIVAFAAVKGHSYGHIAMWNGEQWVSDFKQKSFWVAPQYEKEKKYVLYRWIEK